MQTTKDELIMRGYSYFTLFLIWIVLLNCIILGYRVKTTANQKQETIEITSVGMEAYMLENGGLKLLEEPVKEEKKVGPLRGDIEVVHECRTTGYIQYDVNARIAPSETAVIDHVKSWNEKVQYEYYNENWSIVKGDTEDEYFYVSKDAISNSATSYTYFDVYGDKRKSYMDWTAITAKSSLQYKLQQLAYTADNGVRAVNGRYCIATGSYYTHTVGQYVDLILENGATIQCVIGDCKANQHTNSNNSVGHDGSVAEFIVTTSALPLAATRSGDVSDSTEGWNAKVVGMYVYDKNVFGE